MMPNIQSFQFPQQQQQQQQFENKTTCFVYYSDSENPIPIPRLGQWQVQLKNPRDTRNPFPYTIAAFALENKEDILYRAWNKFCDPKTPDDEFENLKGEFIFNIKTKTISTQTTTLVSDADFFALWYIFIKNFKNLGVFRLCLDCSLYEKLKSLFLNVWKMSEKVTGKGHGDNGNGQFLEIHVDDAIQGFEKSPNCVLKN